MLSHHVPATPTRSISARSHSVRSKLVRAICLTLIASALPVLALAQIYKWTDAEGKVHFGDKPRESAAAESAEEVDISEAYRPDASSAPAAGDSSAASWEAIDARRERAARKEAEENQARAARLEARNNECKRISDKIAELSGIHTVDGVRTRYYLQHDDGRTYTSQEQRDYVEQLRDKARRIGCR